ncbi:polynucleotide adenylyltransferase PcnB [Deferrisoma camini]|uniref:polynucleotide adenylyltransferase PcnB n=1 Tax=Deferrisoma camini TaxID=1035120 RepID=UPI0004B6ED6E|nr:polynucleotide adenylyltransferase PcnB [Deferrisoma camini]
MEDAVEPQSSHPVVLPRSEHPVSRKLIDPDALWILRRLRREGYLAYLVGGAVRDLMLGREPKDFDVGTNARPSEIRRLFRNCRLIGRRFRIVHVYFRRKGQPEKIIEVSTFRGRATWDEEPEAGEIPPEDLDLTGNVFGTPEEDAWRRDFTVNALFYNLADFTVIDHVGGLEDLRRGLIRIIGDPDERFAEDPVRMLRAVEFGVRLGFRIEPETEAGIRRNAPRIAEASPARLREELRQLAQRGILAEVLAQAHRLGLFEALLPEVEEVEGVFPLLERLDAQAREGRPVAESRTLAALALPTVAARYPLRPGVNLEEAQQAIGQPVEALGRRYHVSSFIRHEARELLLSLYRIARGRAYRTKGRFVRKPEFAEAWEWFNAWAEIAGDLDEVVGYWERYLENLNRPAGSGKKRKRRRRRRKPQGEGTGTAEG